MLRHSEAKSGIHVTGDKQSAERIQMIETIKLSHGKQVACFSEKNKKTEQHFGTKPMLFSFLLHWTVLKAQKGPTYVVYRSKNKKTKH